MKRIPDKEQKTISNIMAKREKMMSPNVARPCFVKAQYNPQNPSAILYAGKDEVESTRDIDHE